MALHYKKAEQGDAEAQNNLSAMYYLGTDVFQDLTQALMLRVCLDAA